MRNKKGHRRRRQSAGNGTSKLKQIKGNKGNIIPIAENVNGNAHSSPSFRIVNMNPPPNFQRFCDAWRMPGMPDVIFVRTDIPHRPVGGRTGTVITVDLSTGEMAARYICWPEWKSLREYHELVRVNDFSKCIEVSNEKFQELLEE